MSVKILFQDDYVCKLATYQKKGIPALQFVLLGLTSLRATLERVSSAQRTWCFAT